MSSQKLDGKIGALEASMQLGSEDFAPPAHLESIEELLADRNKRVDLLYHVILNASEGSRRGLLSDMQCLDMNDGAKMRGVAGRLKEEKGSELLATILAGCSPAMQQGLQRDMLALTKVKVKHSSVGAGNVEEEDLEFYCQGKFEWEGQIICCEAVRLCNSRDTLGFCYHHYDSSWKDRLRIIPDEANGVNCRPTPAHQSRLLGTLCPAVVEGIRCCKDTGAGGGFCKDHHKNVATLTTAMKRFKKYRDDLEARLVKKFTNPLRAAATATGL